MFNISQTAIEQAVRDIKAGVTYPDFWTNRYGEEDEQQIVQPEEGKKEEKQAEKQAN
jgi:hypothetical protein